MLVANPATLVEDYDHIWSKDPALNGEVEDFDELYGRWLETGDAEVLAQILHPGKEPTVFKVRHLRGLEKRMLRGHVLSESDPARGEWSEAAIATVGAFAIVGASNLRGHDNKPIELRRELDKEAKAWRLTKEAIIILDDLGEGILTEIGMRAFALMVPSGN
jgi:hypothetical protein